MNHLLLAAFALFPAMAMADCYVEAAGRYSVNVDLLRAIGYHESRLGAVAIDHKNTDGSVDVGEMQINSTNFPALEKFGITPQALREKRCLNIHVGAWILAGFIKKHGNTWRAVGAYGAGDSVKKDAARDGYANCIREDLRKIQSGSIKAVSAAFPVPARATASNESSSRKPRMLEVQ